MGHVSRMLAFSAALRRARAHVTFAARQLDEVAAKSIEREGYPVDRMVGSRVDDLAALDVADLMELETIAKRLNPDAVVVDHYGASGDYLFAIKSTAQCLGVIDDIGGRDLAPADWLLNQNLGADQLNYQLPQTTLLLGTRYALLRDEFSTSRKTFQRAFADDDRRVLITFGGGATGDLVAETLEALEAVRVPLEICCVLADSKDSPNRAYLQSRHAVRILHGPPKMSELMAWADVAICAGGSTVWELCCLGLPMLVFIRADNQKPSSLALQAEGCADVFPEAPASKGDLGSVLADLLTNPERRKAMSTACLRLVDGEGAARAATSLRQRALRSSSRT
jgi:UDP-2,4-diacetamido-2,4,6-trideoxy-beta-L-altropyranose hydrolase